MCNRGSALLLEVNYINSFLLKGIDRELAVHGFSPMIIIIIIEALKASLDKK